MTLRVGIYHEQAGTREAGGIATFVRELAIALADSHEVYLYTGPGEPTRALRESAVDVVQVPPLPRQTAVERLGDQKVSKMLTFLSATRDGTLRHIEANTDVLLTHQFLDDLLLSRAVDVPTVYQYHGVESAGLGSRARERLSATEYHLANSRGTAREVRAEFGRDVDGILSPGVDLDRFSPDVGPAFEREAPTVLFVGRLVERKGIYELVDAIGRADGDIDLCVVGRGDTESVRKRARRRGVADAVRVVGEVPYEPLPGYYAAADVHCHPAFYEPFGMVNIEAMACGTPVVTTDVPGISEYATHRENALLVEPGDVTALSNALVELADSPALRDRLGSAGRETATQYGWKSQAEKLSTFLEQVVESGEVDGVSRSYRQVRSP